MRKSPYWQAFFLGLSYFILLVIFLSKAQAGTDDVFQRHVLKAQILQYITGVPASIQLAQGWCETGFGRPDTIGYERDSVVRYRDTVGYHFCNVFAIMDFPGDYYTGPSATAMGCYHRTTYTWRVYIHPIFSWIDHAYFLWLHNPSRRGKPWNYWIGAKYGVRPEYWQKIKHTIEKYELYKYD